MSSADQYGKSYWLVEVPRSVSADGFISLMADRAEVVAGSLVFSRNDRAEKPGIALLGLPPGSWTSFYAASMIDGRPVAVDHWPNPQPVSLPEVGRP